MPVLESGVTIINVSYGIEFGYFIFTIGLRKRGGNSLGRTRAESHLKRIPKRTRAQRYKLAPSAAPACIGVLYALYCSAYTIPDTNRYIAGLPFQGCSARSRADSVQAVGGGRRVNKPFSARNASPHPAKSGTSDRKKILLSGQTNERVRNE